MKINILKLSALLTILTVSGTVVVANNMSSNQAPEHMTHNMHHHMRELRHIFHTDDTAKLASFMDEHKGFDWNKSYPHLVRYEVVTPLVAAKHFKAKKCVQALKSKKAMNNTKATGFMQDTLIDPFDYVETL